MAKERTPVEGAAFRSRYGPWALVAGASEGLGAEFGRQLAARGLHLVLIARRAGPLEQHARALSAEFGIEARPLAADLADPSVLSILGESAGDVEIGLVVYNAAFSPIGRHLEQSLEDKLRVLDVNCRGPLLLIHQLCPPMVERGRGGVILMTSMSGLQGSALIANYAATKAYDLILGEGLWDELRGDGVDVLAFCAGATRTPNFERSRPTRTGFFSAPMEPEPVVAEALSALGRGPSAVAGRRNRLAQFVMARVLPRRSAVATIGKATRAMYDT
jgi:short-subunit dehydrogenase